MPIAKSTKPTTQAAPRCITLSRVVSESCPSTWWTTGRASTRPINQETDRFTWQPFMVSSCSVHKLQVEHLENTKHNCITCHEIHVHEFLWNEAQLKSRNRNTAILLFQIQWFLSKERNWDQPEQGGTTVPDKPVKQGCLFSGNVYLLQLLTQNGTCDVNQQARCGTPLQAATKRQHARWSLAKFWCLKVWSRKVIFNGMMSANTRVGWLTNVEVGIICNYTKRGRERTKTASWFLCFARRYSSCLPPQFSWQVVWERSSLWFLSTEKWPWQNDCKGDVFSSR